MTEKTTTPTLNVTTREILGKSVKSLRREGQLPGIVYGHKKDNTSVVLSVKDFENIFKDAGHTALVNLKIDGERAHKVLIHDVQVNPSKKTLLHVDFYLVNLKEKLRTEIPLEFVGTTDLVEVEGGTLMTVRDAVEVECLPEALVSQIEVDITKLVAFEDMIHVSDLVAPEGVTILTEGEEVIASVAEPRSEEEMAELDAPTEEGAPEVESETGEAEAETEANDNQDDKTK